MGYRPGKRAIFSHLDNRIQSIQLHLYKLQEHNRLARSHLANVQKQLVAYRAISQQVLRGVVLESQELAQQRSEELMRLEQARKQDMQLALALHMQEAEQKLQNDVLNDAIVLATGYFKANPHVLPSSELLIKRFISRAY